MDLDLTTIIACREATDIDLGAIRNALRKLAPAAILADALGDVPPGTGALVSFNGLSMGILSFSSCLEVEALDYGPCPNFLWMSAKKDLADHRAHIRVMVTGNVTTREELIAAARALTLLTAAVTQVVPATGVLWCASDNLLPPTRFVASARALAENGLTPADIWVRLVAANLPDGLVVGTHGLVAYANRELEFAPTRKLDFGKLGMRIMQMALYLIDSGAELKDGDSIGPENFRVAREEHAYFDPYPVYALQIA